MDCRILVFLAIFNQPIFISCQGDPRMNKVDDNLIHAQGLPQAQGAQLVPVVDPNQNHANVGTKRLQKPNPKLDYDIPQNDDHKREPVPNIPAEQHVEANQKLPQNMQIGRENAQPAQQFQKKSFQEKPPQSQFGLESQQVDGHNPAPGSNVKVVRPGKKQSRNVFGSIADSEECVDDVQRICSGMNHKNNFDILYCLTNNQDNYDISEDCHHYIWSFKLNTTTDPRFHVIAREVCKQPLSILTDCTNYKDSEGKLIPCLLDNKESITAPGCTNFLTKIQTIVFSDYRLICDFVEDCKNDIQRLKCGKIGDGGQTDPEILHSQGDVIDCLETEYEDNNEALTPTCRKQISRLAELSADDYHLDRHLYFKCKHDREVLCPDVVAGQGRVYKCLFDHKFDQKMSHDCRESLTGRQKLVAEDYKASYGLAHHCKVEIEKNQCASKGKTKDDNISLASIMLCLENQNLNGVPISPDCDDELIEYRRIIMEDFELSPEIVHECSREIRTNCKNGLEKEGKTLHCLLAMAQDDNGLNSNCQKALMDLIKETEVAQDYRIDTVLTRACESVIQAKCSDLQSGDPMVLSCLMDNLHSKQMKKKCKAKLLELQYFISRDFLIDPVFRERCKSDAATFCFAPHLHGAGAGADDASPDEGNEVDPIPFSIVMSCLYRHIHSSMDDTDREHAGGSLSSECEEEVHRVIKQRALDFNLNPDLERSCRKELGELCSEQVHEKGTEVACLQENYEKLKPGDCRKQIKKLTQLESQNAEDFDSILIRECEPMLQKYCSSLLDQDDEGKIMECLIKNKEEMESSACAAGVTHFQLIEMKDFDFNYKFLKACKKDVDKHCVAKDIRTKMDVVRCLSLEVRNAVLGNKEMSISSQCREQLTVENLQLHKNIELNPELKKACSRDQAQFCPHVKSGKAQVIECLRENKHDLSHSCYKALYGFEQDEAENPQLDFQLMRGCKSDIKEHCMQHLSSGDPQLIVECLIKKKHSLVKGCRVLVVEREKEMYSDISLNPDLLKSCSADIKRLCGDAEMKAKKELSDGADPEGIVYKCLKQKFVSKSKKNALSMSCYRHVEFVMMEQEKNYILDPQLTLHCFKSIKELCPPKEGKNVIECLKDRYFEGSLAKDEQCMVEVARLLAEGQSDIMADPALHQACATDLTKHCHRVPEGQGRLIACLSNVAKHDESALAPECADELDLRIKMWKAAMKVNPKDFVDVFNVVMESDQSSYMFSVLTLFIVCILLLGTCCGRLSKRVTRERKTR